MKTAKQRQEAFQIYNQIVEGLEIAYNNQKINEADFSQLKIKSLAELEESLADLTQLKDTELIEYSNNSMTNNYANFNMGTYFVPALLEQIENDYETLEDGMMDIMQVTGINEEQLEGLFTGELVPTPEFVDMLNDLYTATSSSNEDALAFQVLAALDRGDLDPEDVNEVLEEDDEDYDYDESEEDDEEDNDEEEESDEEDEEVDAEAVYSYIDPRVQALESKIADFELNSELKDRLNEVADFARQGIQERWLSKAKYDLLLGSFDREEDRVAAFSQTAESNNVDLATQLYAVLFALKADEECGDPRINFSSYVTESTTPIDMEEAALAQFQVQKMIEDKRLFSKVRR